MNADDSLAVDGVLETCLYVQDLDQARSFYAEVLRLPVIEEQPVRHVFFRCGNSMLLIFNPQTSRLDDGDPPPHGAEGPGHVAFAVAPQMLDAWLVHLRDRGVEIEQRIDWPGGGRSIYFRDPDGNSLELTSPAIWGLDESTGVSRNVQQ